MQKSALLRQIQIDLITDMPNPIVSWFSDLWDSLSKIEINVFHANGEEIIYFIDNNIWPWVFYHNKADGMLVCNYDHYWSDFANDRSIQHADIKAITEFLVGRALNGEEMWAIDDDSVSYDPFQDALNGNILEWRQNAKKTDVHTL
jgi:hypothetical protein